MMIIINHANCQQLLAIMACDTQRNKASSTICRCSRFPKVDFGEFLLDYQIRALQNHITLIQLVANFV